MRKELSVKQQFYYTSSVQCSSSSLKGYQASVMVGSPTQPSHLFSIQTLWLVQPSQISVKVRESETAWALFAGSGIGSGIRSGGKRQKTGWNRKNIGERSEQRGGLRRGKGRAPPFSSPDYPRYPRFTRRFIFSTKPILFSFLPNAEPCPRLSDYGKGLLFHINDRQRLTGLGGWS